MTEHAAGKTGKAGNDKSASAVPNPVIIGIGGGVAAGIASSFIPMGAIEGFVSAYGIAELLPAAAPPLGNTARLALSTGIGTLTAGALLALLPRGETHDMGFESAVTTNTAGPDPINGQPKPAKLAKPAKSSSAGSGSKLAGWLRTLRFGKTGAAPGTVTNFADIPRNRIRAEDQHLDAPIRAPILASSDLGEPLDSPSGDRAPMQAVPPYAVPNPPFHLGEHMAVAPQLEPATASMRFAAPAERAPIFATPPREPVEEPVATAAHEPEQPRFSQAAPEHRSTEAVDASSGEVNDVAEVKAYMPLAAPTLLAPDTDQLSIAALLERLESGLQRRMGQPHPATAEKPAPDTRLIRLAEIEPTPVAAVPPLASDGAAAETTQPFRFRVQGHDDAATAAQDRLGALASSWNGEVEYHEPAVGADFHAALDGAARPLPGLERDTSAASMPGTTLPHGQAAADDDMDAALRDALATLRQLSDRQRNA